MIRTLEELRQFEDYCLYNIVNKNGNELTEKEKTEIKNVYSSNGLQWWQDGKMTKQNYTFSLYKINNTIVGVSGIDHDDLEIRDDSIHKDYQNRGFYKRLMKHTNNWLKINKPQGVYYLFTEKTGNPNIDKIKILNHINSGLVLLDRTTERESTYTSNINKKTYYGLGDNDYIIFRTSGHHKINFLTYTARNGGNCSGIYIGNGIILTADHCDREEIDDWKNEPIRVTRLIFPFKNPGGFNINVSGSSEFIRYPLRLYGGENFTNDFAIIKLSQDKVKDFNQDMEVIPLLQDNISIHGKAINDGRVNYPSKSESEKSEFYTYGINYRNIRVSNIMNFNNLEISRHYRNYNIPKNMRKDILLDTLNNYREKLNCVQITNGLDLSQGDSGGPHYHIKKETGQMVYIGPTGAKPYSYCKTRKEVVIASVYQHINFIKDNNKNNILLYNLENDVFLFE